MLRDRLVPLQDRIQAIIRKLTHRGMVPAMWLTIALSCLIGVAAGCGAAAFTLFIESASDLTVRPTLDRISQHPWWNVVLLFVPALGLLLVSWFTRRFAPEAQGHGVPEVIVAVARHDGVIRPRVSIVKILASAVCIGTGGSVGREGPIVQIGSAVGSVFGQWFRLSARNIKVLVAAGAAAGISATFNAPLAGVIFASEIILGSFVAESLVPIVIASVVADVVQIRIGEHGLDPAFRNLTFSYEGDWGQLPGYFALGLVCGLAAVLFTKLVYATEDLSQRLLPKWWVRALVLGLVVGAAGVAYPPLPPTNSRASLDGLAEGNEPLPPLFGVGYGVVDHAVHLTNDDFDGATSEHVRLSRSDLLKELWWLLPLVFLKPLMTSVTLGGGGSGGIFAPSLFLGATVGASFGLLCNIFIPGVSAHPGVYAIVGMGAVVAGTTHGVLSAILIVYELTSQDSIILPIMIAAGLASVVARLIDPESIYHKKLSRRGESIARGHEMHYLEHIMVRDVMLREFPTVKQDDDVNEIIRVARSNPTIESLPVMNPEGHLIGIIRPEDLHRVLDSDVPPNLVQAEDIALKSPVSVSPDENLLEAIRDFGTRDIDTLPVEVGSGKSKRLIGLLLRADVMRRYREEMLSAH
ncbi:MAG: chloride channel protein [Planctomycetes bacterium]|nr:chloride channel protein [Planctomycetota bacterium]